MLVVRNRFLLFILFLSTIGCNNSKLDLLVEENNDLKAQLDSILELHETLENRVVLLPRSNTLQLGEEYEAELFMTTSQKENPAYAEFYIEFENNIDTIKATSSDVGQAYIKFTPSDTGHFNFLGLFRQELLGKTTEMKIPIEFTVQ